MLRKVMSNKKMLLYTLHEVWMKLSLCFHVLNVPYLNEQLCWQRRLNIIIESWNSTEINMKYEQLILVIQEFFFSFLCELTLSALS